MTGFLIGAGIYLVLLFFTVRFFQTVHGWDEQMAGLVAKKEQALQEKRKLHGRQKHPHVLRRKLHIHKQETTVAH